MKKFSHFQTFRTRRKPSLFFIDLRVLEEANHPLSGAPRPLELEIGK